MFVTVFTVIGVVATAACSLLYGFGCGNISITSPNFGAG